MSYQYDPIENEDAVRGRRECDKTRVLRLRELRRAIVAAGSKGLTREQLYKLGWKAGEIAALAKQRLIRGKGIPLGRPFDKVGKFVPWIAAPMEALEG